MSNSHSQKFVIAVGLVFVAIFIVWLGYRWSGRESAPAIPVAEYSINGMATAVVADGRQIAITVPVLSVTGAGTSVSRTGKSILVSDKTAFIKSELVDGKLLFTPAEFQDVTAGAQLIVYTFVNPESSQQIPAARVEINE